MTQLFSDLIEAPGIKDLTLRIAQEPKGALLGDVNLDGFVTFLDIAPFITLISMNEFQAEADLNGDLAVDFLDIAPFIDAIASAGS